MTTREQLVDAVIDAARRYLDRELADDPTIADNGAALHELAQALRALAELEQQQLGREADRVRRELADDPTVTPAELGELVEQADLADQARDLAAEVDVDAGGIVPLELGRQLTRSIGDQLAGAPRIDDAVIDDELGGRFAREVGMCCNHRCRRFEYLVAVDGDPELATCTECTQRLVHESGLTWADAAAAGYRRDTSTERG